jgi:lipoprotein NlpD
MILGISGCVQTSMPMVPKAPIPVTRLGKTKLPSLPTTKTVVKNTPWQWPVLGKARYTNHGLDIMGCIGASIVAADGGEVVYSGQGLAEYGKVIMIKHANGYLTVYGHNKTLKVKEGEIVKRGQAIAEMGQTPTKEILLRFEMRQNGDLIDPRKYLPI